ncbi:MAG TPA: exodeoxyribonuclease VII large subunit, partial [Gemmataceae bacterium]
VYLTLKDERSQLKAVIYRGVALRLRFEPHDGMEVLAQGKISVYPPRGEYQLNIVQLHPKGIGALELALRQLKEKLLLRGYFDPKRKKPLPRYPSRIALVTSPTGAAVRDMLEILARRWPVAEVVVRGVRVQGEGAAEEIAAAIRLLNRLQREGRARFDLMIVGRGGGSIEDLWAFNEEIVADAIYESAIPVVSAVGHEIDVTVADLVADCRAPTPSAAAELVTPDREEVLAGLREYRRRLRDALGRRVVLARQRLDELAARRALRAPLERVRELERRLDELGERLRRVVSNRLAREGERVAAAAGRLETLSPLNVLRRGYSLTRIEPDRALVRSARQVAPGQRLRTTLPDGDIVSRVESVEPGTAPTRPEARQRGGTHDQPG